MLSSEIQQTLLRPKTERPSLDGEVFANFKKIHPQEIYANLTVRDPERKQQIKNAWHNGENADLTTTTPDEQELTDTAEKLLAFKCGVLARRDLNPEVKQLYRWKINEDIANIRMLQASARGDMRGFHRWNEFIYGKPDEAIYRAALDIVANDTETILADEGTSDEAKTAAIKVLEQLQEKRGDKDLLLPDSDLFKKLHEDHWRFGGYYTLLLSGVEIPHGDITPEIGTPILDIVVRHNLESGYSLRPTKANSWEVSHGDEAVKYPKDYNMAHERFIGLALGHETGTHLLETVNGLRSNLLLGSIGLDRQEVGGEGRGVVREQLAYNNIDDFTKLVRWRDILRRHIAISYAHGLDDGAKASSEVFEFINAIDVMYQFIDTPEKTVDEIIDSAQEKTDTLLLRVLKGTDGEGGAYLKDKVYLEGMVATWLTVAKRGVKSVSEGDIAKHDISNTRHTLALRAIGVLSNENVGDRMDTR